VAPLDYVWGLLDGGLVVQVYVFRGGIFGWLFLLPLGGDKVLEELYFFEEFAVLLPVFLLVVSQTLFHLLVLLLDLFPLQFLLMELEHQRIVFVTQLLILVPEFLPLFLQLRHLIIRCLQRVLR